MPQESFPVVSLVSWISCPLAFLFTWSGSSKDWNLEEVDMPKALAPHIPLTLKRAPGYLLKLSYHQAEWSYRDPFRAHWVLAILPFCQVSPVAANLRWKRPPCSLRHSHVWAELASGCLGILCLGAGTFNFFLFFLFNFWPHNMARGIFIPQSGINPHPLQCRHGVLTTGSLRKSPFNLLNMF